MDTTQRRNTPSGMPGPALVIAVHLAALLSVATLVVGLTLASIVLMR